MTVMTTPPAKQRDLADNSPERIRRARQAHEEAVRKLAAAAASACRNGATWDEIRQAVERGVSEVVPEGCEFAVLAATARARVHDGDDRM